MSELATDLTDDDMSLARRIAEGDRSAFELMMRRHNRRLYRLARATLRNHAEAEDALQDAYLHAYRSMSQFRGDARLSTWLSRLVLNECFARLRRSARRQNVIPIVDAPDYAEHADAMTAHADAPDEALARAQVRALLERKLDELPELFRMVFVLRSIEEMSVEETAQCLRIPEATVRSRHFRARSLLRESLAQAFDLAERDVFEFGGARCDRIVAGVMSKLSGDAARTP
ncbi:RNA polymerase sigma factor (plasmid) [Burkholderia sp. SFA1]|uniref:RNA polymerase sigma factor n=1 Tax=unclassified Caballeronia TaxID=2646786 RepID=UPI001F2F4A29|nr:MULTISPECIES: RNA polymerase sigma factor [unclassified Caballeronia]MCE4545577.1 RNA polymerase sigma factor [Caballeronia sp. PC1]MCE4572299.1 RNA polymerase sigma factor [Caballeronia sp. CLC5]BBQ00928.1 RNA polymerase sigma factor [Burkholderia sp. SFA1]